MCGICGIINNHKEHIDEAKVRAMLGAMAHRGPDDEGVYNSKGACLGHRRLSIIDLSGAGHQPLSNENKTVWVVLNGEIYNYKDLRSGLEKKGHKFSSNSDTEVIVHLYEEEGRDCVKALIGMFAFGLWDAEKKLLLLARDRIGKKPLLYSFIDGFFSFASEFQGLLQSGLVRKEINAQALDYYLTFGYIPAPLTIYKNVFKLKPAHTLIFKDGQIQTEKYWQLNYENKIAVSEGEAQERILHLLLDAVRIRLYSDVPLGVFLSGGIDSSVVVALMSRVSGQKIKTFSIGFDESDYNELKFARNIAKYFDTDHHEFIVRPKALEILPMLAQHYGEPYGDPSCIPTYYLSKMCRQYVTVALNGDGGDEDFAGYERYQAMVYSELLNRCPKVFTAAAGYLAQNYIPESIDSRKIIGKTRRFLEAVPLPAYKRYVRWIGVFDERLKKGIYTEDFLRQSANFSTERFTDDCISKGNAKLSLVDRLLQLDTLTYLPDDLLVKVDIASMANALEVRSPFLDHRLMEFAASLPSRLKLKGCIKKYILKKLASKIIPHQNVYRSKKGFGVPVGMWFRHELKEFLCDNLFSQEFLSCGYFSPELVKGMVKQHLSYKKNYGLQLWAILMFKLWFDKFMNNS